MLHVIYGGTSYDYSFNEADISMESSDAQIKQALAGLLGIPESKLLAWAVDRSVGDNITVRAQAVFGII